MRKVYTPPTIANKWTNTNLIIPSVWQDCGALGSLLCCLIGVFIGSNPLENYLTLSAAAKHMHIYDQLWVRDKYNSIHYSYVRNSGKQKQNKTTQNINLQRRWTMKSEFIHKMEHHTSIQREWTIETNNNMDESHRHYLEPKKQTYKSTFGIREYESQRTRKTALWW